MIYSDSQGTYYKVSKESPKGFPNLFIAMMGKDPTNLDETALTVEQIKKLVRVKARDLPEDWCRAFKVKPKAKLEPAAPVLEDQSESVGQVFDWWFILIPGWFFAFLIIIFCKVWDLFR